MDKIQPRLPETPQFPSKSSFLFTAIVHICMFTGSTLGILWALPYIWYALKCRKLSALVGAMAMYKASPAEARPINFTVNTADRLTVLDIPANNVTKLVCHDPWVSFILALITVIGLIVYLYQNCKHLTLVKGYKFASICHIHLVLGNATRYVPFKIGQFVGSPFLFQYNSSPQVDQITLKKEILWDHLHINWQDQQVSYKNKRIPLKEHVTVPLKDRLRLRNIFDNSFHALLMVKQGNTWYNLRHKTEKNVKFFLLFSDAHPSSKEVNRFWFHSTEGQQLLKLAMEEHAISASCTVRTSSGVHHLNYNRQGDSTQRFVPYNGNQMKGKKATMELHRYLRESTTRRQSVRFGSIPRNPSPPENRRARGLREGRNPSAPRRRYYSPEIKPLSEEEHRRQVSAPPTLAYKKGRRYPSRAFRQDNLARRAPMATQVKRSRTPSPEAWPYKRGPGVLSQRPYTQSTPRAAQTPGSETDSAPPPEHQESPESPRELPQRTLAQDREILEQKIKEFTKEKERLNKENERLDKENDELDRWIEKRERMNKWLDDVSEALKQGAPVPEQPEDSELVYPGYREDSEASEGCSRGCREDPCIKCSEGLCTRQPGKIYTRPHLPGRGGPKQ